VTAERVNLRAGPSDDANVRGQLTQGEQVIELRSDGNWYGVRVLRTGEEGWIYGDLIERVAESTLGEGGIGSAGYSDLSQDFDKLMANLSQRLGHPLFRGTPRTNGNELRAELSPAWLRAGSAAEHLLTATTLYQMWKNHQNSAPVRVMLLDPTGADYITIDETVAAAPLVSVTAPD
jgi:uncharacterized protein YgiM (DUF1202 family)